MKTFTTYNQALEYLYNTKKPSFGDHTPGEHLARIKKFLNLAGNPQDSYPTIHITGTAGKGSTCYLTAKILAEYGLKVGLHMSPHLVSLNEKFQILETNKKRDIQPVNCTNTKFVELINWYIKIKDKYYPGDKSSLTYYEIIIALVFKYFEMQKVDVAVIEVALGGRYDATNVINSDIAVLTSVGLDHMELLGDTVEEITQDKMHIMKPSKYFISGLRDKKLNNLIKNHAKNLSCKLDIIGKDFDYEVLYSNLSGSEFKFRNSNLDWQNYKLNLVGNFQIHNAALAIQTSTLFLQSFEPPISNFKSQILNSFGDVHLLARFDIIQQDPPIILDGAHNELKMRKVIANIKTCFPNKNFKLLISFKQKKEMEPILAHLAQLKTNQIFVTEFKRKYYTNIQSYSISEMKKVTQKSFGPSIDIVEYKNPWQAYKKMQKSLKPDEVGLATGSLYLLGEIYKKIV